MSGEKPIKTEVSAKKPMTGVQFAKRAAGAFVGIIVIMLIIAMSSDDDNEKLTAEAYKAGAQNRIVEKIVCGKKDAYVLDGKLYCTADDDDS